jgi:nucleoside-diphosphate-sugar epimerase
MKLLFLGGTGNISTACVAVALEAGHDVTVLTRGRRTSAPDSGVRTETGERDDEELLHRLAAGTRFDAVVDFLGFRPEQIEVTIAAFSGRIGQYVFISSTSAYQKPPTHYLVSEGTPLANPFWEYARQKIACEERLLRARETGFPATIVRPSYTYGPTWIPSAFGGQDFTVVDRMRRGLPIVSHGDGTSLWVMTWNGDFARGLLGLLGNPAALGEAVHITSDEVLTWDEIYREMGRAAGVEPRIVHVSSDLIAAVCPERAGSLLGDKAHSMVFDNRKIKRLVPGYSAGVGFAEGVARSVAWFDADPGRRQVSAAMNEKIDRVLAAERRARGQ